MFRVIDNDATGEALDERDTRDEITQEGGRRMLVSILAEYKDISISTGTSGMLMAALGSCVTSQGA
jgi:hypothetical protein